MLAALLGLALSTPARAADARLWLAAGADPERARAAAALLGHDAPELLPLEALPQAVQVVGLIDRRLEDLCGGPVQIEGWRSRLQAARQQLQLLDLDGALGAFSILEAELPCLTDRLDPDDVFRFHLSFTELHQVASRSYPGDPTRTDFHAREAVEAAHRAATAGPSAPMPEDTLAEAAELVVQARAAQVGQLPARVVVAGPHDRVWWDGSPARSGPFDLPAGSHVFQLTDSTQEDQVVAVEVSELAPGAAAVVWARPDGAPLDQRQLKEAVQTLVETGRAPVGLAPTLQALSSGGPSYLVTGDADQVRLWGADGDQVRLRIVDPPGPTTTGAPTGRTGPGGGDYAVELGLVGGLVDGPELGMGPAVGGRVGLHRAVVLTVGLEAMATGMPGASDWPDRGRVEVHGGLRGRLASRLWDLGVEGGVSLPTGADVEGAVPEPVVRGVSSLRLPPGSLAGLRLSAFGGWLAPTSWQVGGGLAVELGTVAD